MSKILIVEDDLGIAQNLTELLQLEGYETRHISSDADIKREAIALSPQLIICSPTYRNKSRFCDFVCLALITHLMFLLDTNSPKAIAEVKALNIPFLVKPYRMGELLELVSALI